MRSGWMMLALATATPAVAQSYHVAGQLPAGDGGWDLASVDPVAQRLYVARPDGVTAIDLRTGKATDRIVPGQRAHAALAIAGTHDVLSTNGEFEHGDAVRRDHRQGPGDHSDWHEARRRSLRPAHADRLGDESG